MTSPTAMACLACSSNLWLVRSQPLDGGLMMVCAGCGEGHLWREGQLSRILPAPEDGHPC